MARDLRLHLSSYGDGLVIVHRGPNRRFLAESQTGSLDIPPCYEDSIISSERYSDYGEVESEVCDLDTCDLEERVSLSAQILPILVQDGQPLQNHRDKPQHNLLFVNRNIGIPLTTSKTAEIP